MTSTKHTREKNDDDLFIENFARDFFGTNQPDLESIPKRTPVVLADTEEEKRTHKETDAPKTNKTYKKKTERDVENRRNASKKNSRRDSSDVQRNDSGQSPSVKRFLELRDEFLSLSDRLHDASITNVSDKLIQVLSERQKLVKTLLDMSNVSSAQNFGPDKEEMRLHHQSGSTNGSSKQEFGMPKKSKSVHWSDEHLGGSIILDPSLYAEKTYKSSSTHAQTPGRHEESNISKPPPRYKTSDRCTQTSRDREKKESGRNSNEHLRMKVDLELDYVEAILNEAAELRREACGMIWRAHYLEQLCDVDGLVKHVYRSTSNAPTVPRYPHLYR